MPLAGGSPTGTYAALGSVLFIPAASRRGMPFSSMSKPGTSSCGLTRNPGRPAGENRLNIWVISAGGSGGEAQHVDHGEKAQRSGRRSRRAVSTGDLPVGTVGYLSISQDNLK